MGRQITVADSRPQPCSIGWSLASGEHFRQSRLTHDLRHLYCYQLVKPY